MLLSRNWTLNLLALDFKRMYCNQFCVSSRLEESRFRPEQSAESFAAPMGPNVGYWPFHLWKNDKATYLGPPVNHSFEQTKIKPKWDCCWQPSDKLSIKQTHGGLFDTLTGHESRQGLLFWQKGSKLGWMERWILLSFFLEYRDLFGSDQAAQ